MLNKLSFLRGNPQIRLSLLGMESTITTTTSTTTRSMGQGFKVYTKTGDAGESSLFAGDRLPKSDHIFHSLGTIDELNANLGLARDHYSTMLQLR